MRATGNAADNSSACVYFVPEVLAVLQALLELRADAPALLKSFTEGRTIYATEMQTVFLTYIDCMTRIVY